MSDYPMLISNKLHSFRNFLMQIYNIFKKTKKKYFVFLKKYHFYKISNNKHRQYNAIQHI